MDAFSRKDAGSGGPAQRQRQATEQAERPHGAVMTLKARDAVGVPELGTWGHNGPPATRRSPPITTSEAHTVRSSTPTSSRIAIPSPPMRHQRVTATEAMLSRSRTSRGEDVNNCTVRLLDRWKAHFEIESDYEAARELGVSRNAISQWRNRPSQASAMVIMRMAADLGENPLTHLKAMAKEGKAGPTPAKPPKAANGARTPTVPHQYRHNR